MLFYHVSLTQEISHFLQADSRSEPVSRLEGLKLLRHSFAENKDQLVDLVGRGEGNDVSECDGDETVFIRSENPRSLRTSFEHFETLVTSIDDSMNSCLNLNCGLKRIWMIRTVFCASWVDLSRYYLSGAKSCEGHKHSIATSLLFDSKVVDIELR